MDPVKVMLVVSAEWGDVPAEWTGEGRAWARHLSFSREVKVPGVKSPRGRGAIYRVGSVVVDHILEHWSQWKEGPPAAVEAADRRPQVPFG
jgi:purine nucleoside permease